MQKNVVVCNQRAQAQAGYDNATAAHKSYRKSLGSPPTPDKDRKFAMVMGAKIIGGDLDEVTLFFCTPEILKPKAKLGFLAPLFATVAFDECHEKNLKAMVT